MKDFYIVKLLLFILCIKQIISHQFNLGNCIFENSSISRTNCGWDKISQNDCESRGCCFDQFSDNNLISCFYQNSEYEEILFPSKYSIKLDKSNNSFCNFSNPLTSRTKCNNSDEDEISREHCESLGCCFDNSFRNSHNCFYPNSEAIHLQLMNNYIFAYGYNRSKHENCYFGNPFLRRTNCGWPGISMQECENRDCCYDDSFQNVKKCFHKNIQIENESSAFVDNFHSNKKIQTHSYIYFSLIGNEENKLELKYWKAINLGLKNKNLTDSIFGKERRLINSYLLSDIGINKTFNYNTGNLSQSGKYNLTVLHYASFFGFEEIVKYLTEKYFDLNPKDKENNLPLHFASSNGHVKIVEKLLLNSQSLNAKNMNGLTPLHLATSKGHIDIVQTLLQKGANISVVDKNSWTPLHYASFYGHLEIVRLLIDSKSEINAFDINNSTPLYLALLNNHTDVGKLLLESGADCELPNKWKSTPLHEASKNGDIEIMKNLTANWTSLDLSNEQNETPLYIAASHGHYEIVKLLLSKNANVNGDPKNKITPIRIALDKNYMNIVQLLVENGSTRSNFSMPSYTHLHLAAQDSNFEFAQFLLKFNHSNVNALASRNYTPLNLAAINGHFAVCKMLLDNGALIDSKEIELTSLHQSASRGYLAIVELLLDRGGNMSKIEPTNLQTPLHKASVNGHLNIVKVLTENGSNIDVKDKKGNTPLHIASLNGHFQVVKYLLKNGANLKARNINNEIPLHLSSAGGFPKIVQFLLAKGADANALDAEMKTPLLGASSHGHLNIVEILLINGANFDAVDLNQANALHLASSIGHIETAKLFIKRGIGVNSVNKYKWTPLNFATLNGHLNTVKYLAKMGANINAVTEDNKTSLDIAKEKEHKEIEMFLIEEKEKSSNKEEKFSGKKENDEEEKENGKEENTEMTILFVSIPVIIISLLSIIIYLIVIYRRKKLELNRFLNEEEIKAFKEGTSIYNTILGQNTIFVKYNRNYEVKKEQIKMGKKILGSGYFGIVTDGQIEMENKCFDVAIKVVKSGVELPHIKALLDELKIMSAIGKHENIITLVAACTENISNNEIYVAVEYCGLGNLLENVMKFEKKIYLNSRKNIANSELWIHEEKRNSKDTLDKLIKWAFQIANGMDFLSSNKIIHCDLAARNVLLTLSSQIKICDFGLSRQLFSDATYTKKSASHPLPWKWMSIESLEAFRFSHKSDVWSFGVTLWEMFSFGKIPYAGSNWSTEFVTELKNGKRLTKPDFCSNKIYYLMIVCWHENPDDRPTFLDLKHHIMNGDLNIQTEQLNSYFI